MEIKCLTSNVRHLIRKKGVIYLKKKNKIILTLSLVAVFAVLAAIFGIYDLQISVAVANPESDFGIAMEILGELVAPILFVLAGFTIILYSVRLNIVEYKKSKIATGFICMMVGIGYSVYDLSKLSYIKSIISYIVVGILIGIFMSIIYKQSNKRLEYLIKIAVITVVYLIAMLVIINVFKMVWGRIRFRQMLALSDLSLFTPWYLPQGFTGYRSFPSGHTANASSLYVLTLFAVFCKKKWQKILCYTVPVVWIIFMASTRVLVGAHYCSDVLFGAGISVVIFLITKNILNKKFKTPVSE